MLEHVYSSNTPIKLFHQDQIRGLSTLKNSFLYFLMKENKSFFVFKREVIFKNLKLLGQVIGMVLEKV